MNRMNIKSIFYIFFALAIAGLTTSCKKQVTRSNISYIIGDNNMETIIKNNPTYQKYKYAIDASLLIVTKTPHGTNQFCSGILIRTRNGVQVLTNHHCFAIKGSNGLATESLHSTACVDTNVYFNIIEGGLESATKASCIPGSLETSFNADIATFSIEGNVPQNTTPITLFPTMEVADRKAFIIHYPAESTTFQYVPKFNMSMPLAKVTEEDCKVIGKFPYDEARQVPVLSVSHRHTCDLVQGSSGSPLIDLTTQQLLGVNWGGIKVQSGSDVRTDNAATSSVMVNEFLDKNQTSNVLTSSLDALVANGGKKEASKEVKEPACGSIGYTTKGYSLWLLLFAIPTFISLYNRKYTI